MKDHCAEHEPRTVAIASLEANMKLFKWVFGGGMIAIMTIGLYMFGSIGTDISFVRSDITAIKNEHTTMTAQFAVVQNEIIHINKQLGNGK